jgi:serine/threonine-protein kinase
MESQPAATPSVLPETAKPASPARAAGVTAPASSHGVMTEEGGAGQLDPFARTGEVEEVKVLRDRAGNRLGVATPVATKVTPIPASSPHVVLAPPAAPVHRTYSTRQKIGLASIALLLVAMITGWFLIQRARTESSASSPQKAAVAQPSVQPTPAITPQTAPSPQSNASLAPPPGMVYVSGGTFQMGRNDGEDWERPAHMVTVAPFFMDLTEVTNEQYQEFVNQTDHRPPPYWKDGRYPEGAGRLPVVNISWPDAKAYAEWAGKRLPTEAEWELTARGTSGRLYPWGSEWNAALANTKENNRGSVMEVGRFAAGASPFGALDMCGNVWEWTASDALSYLIKGRVIADGKVIRGGAFNVPHDKATATYRGVAQPEKNTYDKIGFRCARDMK